MCTSDCFLALIAVLFPPLPVWVKRGLCSADSVINILLCVLGYLPGLIHSWYIITRYPDEYEYQALDAENGRIYVFVHNAHSGGGQQQQGGRHFVPQGQQQPKLQHQPSPHGNMNYGTASAPAPSSSSAPAPSPQPRNTHDAGEGPSDAAPPPSYAQVVAGDHKVQSQD